MEGAQGSMVGARRRRRGAQSAARPRRNARLANNDSFAAMRLARNQTSDLPTDSLLGIARAVASLFCRRRTPWTRGSCPRLSTATPTPGLSPTPTLTSTARRSRRMHPRAASGGARAWCLEVATCVSRKHRREALGATARLPRSAAAHRVRDHRARARAPPAARAGRRVRHADGRRRAGIVPGRRTPPQPTGIVRKKRPRGRPRRETTPTPPSKKRKPYDPHKDLRLGRFFRFRVDASGEPGRDDAAPPRWVHGITSHRINARGEHHGKYWVLRDPERGEYDTHEQGWAATLAQDDDARFPEPLDVARLERDGLLEYVDLHFFPRTRPRPATLEPKPRRKRTAATATARVRIARSARMTSTTAIRTDQGCRFGCRRGRRRGCRSRRCR